MTPEIVTQFGPPPYRIDLLTAIDGVTFKDVWASATTVAVQGHQLRVIGLQQLRAKKAATGRAKDEGDVRKLAKPRVRKPR